MAASVHAERITTDPEPFARNLIAPGYRAGNLVFTSGQVAVDADQNVVGVGDFDVQAEQVFKNLEDVLAAGGSSLKNVIKTNIYVTDVGNLSKILELRKRYFTPPYPASTLIGVNELVWPELMLEIEVIAIADES